MTVQYDSNGFPKTLLDWRREPRNECFTVRHLWYPLETFFSSKGYTFFVSNSKYEGCHTTAVEGEERAPDEFHYVLPEDLRGDRCQYIHHSNKLIPATHVDGRHVIIHLVCKADQGYQELEILRYFSQPGIKEHPKNHVIPLLEELEYLDMVFAVTPLLSSGGFAVPWFYNYGEAVDAVPQTFEAMCFIHSHLVAHRDFCESGIIHNFGGSRWAPQALKARDSRAPFGFFFRVATTYWISNCLSSSIRILIRQTASSRGYLPFIAIRGTHDPKKYGKSGQAANHNCPFASDVFQLGKVFQEKLLPHHQALVNLLEETTVSDPAKRLKIPQVLETFTRYRENLPNDILSLPVTEFDL